MVNSAKQRRSCEARVEAMTILETFYIELYFALALTLPACFAQGLPVAKFTTTVTDESGTPIKKAQDRNDLKAP